MRVDYGKKENRARPADNMALGEFLSIYNDSDRYLVDTLPEEMWPEFSLPSCLLCGGFASRLQVSPKSDEHKLDKFRFLGNCPPTPPLNQHYHLLLT